MQHLWAAFQSCRVFLSWWYALRFVLLHAKSSLIGGCHFSHPPVNPLILVRVKGNIISVINPQPHVAFSPFTKQPSVRQPFRLWINTQDRGILELMGNLLKLANYKHFRTVVCFFPLAFNMQIYANFTAFKCVSTTFGITCLCAALAGILSDFHWPGFRLWRFGVGGSFGL